MAVGAVRRAAFVRNIRSRTADRSAGTIFTATERDLVAITDLRRSGSVRWKFHTRKQIEVSSGVSKDGIVVLGTNNDQEYGIRSDGTKAWQFPLHDYTYSSSAVRHEGTAYFADNSGRVRTVDAATGKIVRTVAPAAPKHEHAWTSVVADAAGSTYWAITGNVYGYDSSGAALFTLALDAGADGYPALGADGTLYVGSTAVTLYAVG